MTLMIIRLFASLTVIVLASAPVSAAELYRWLDEKGVVNYSNTLPAKTRSGKSPAATLVEDRVSVYTPDRRVMEEIERGKERRAQPVAPTTSFTRDEDKRVIAPPPAPPVAYDPCLNPGDPNCTGYLYNGAPVFYGRRRQQPLIQPQLPPGTLAGQGAGPGAYIPGQSGTAMPPPTQSSRSTGAGFTVRGEREREFPRR